MTPKEKAKELVNKLNLDNWDDAIDCALICVDEIMEFTIHKKSDLYYKFEIYWNEVKQEINKL